MGDLMRNTEKNLIMAFIDEIQARNRYELFANIAKRDGYLLISKFFDEIANEEKMNANWNYLMYQQVKKGELNKKIKLEIEASIYYGKTIENLTNAIAEEDYQWKEKYPNFANVADKEGFTDIATRLREIANYKKQNSNRFKMLLKIIKNDPLFNNTELVAWKCLQCSFYIAMNELPEDYICPTCGHLKPYFQRELYRLEGEDNLIKPKKKIIWICMKCGYKKEIDELSADWKCPTCGHNKSYFKRKPSEIKNDYKLIKHREMAVYICTECGYDSKIELPDDWKCPECGHPKNI